MMRISCIFELLIVAFGVVLLILEKLSFPGIAVFVLFAFALFCVSLFFDDDGRKPQGYVSPLFVPGNSYGYRNRRTKRDSK